jgi:hypothetical protein
MAAEGDEQEEEEDDDDDDDDDDDELLVGDEEEEEEDEGLLLHQRGGGQMELCRTEPLEKRQRTQSFGLAQRKATNNNHSNEVGTKTAVKTTASAPSQGAQMMDTCEFITGVGIIPLCHNVF